MIQNYFKMKNYLFITILAVVSLLNQAFTHPVKPETQCRFDSIHMSFAPVDIYKRVTLDLINRTWVEHLHAHTGDAVNRTFEFIELGIVTITTTFENQTQATKTMVWRLEKEDGQTFLILTNTATDMATQYEVTETCKGLELNDVLLNKPIELLVK